MPSYVNPYYGPTYTPVNYFTTGQYQPVQQMPVQQSFASVPACAMAWVDGEIEARGRQIPQGVTQFAMWDTNKQVIYLKSLNQMGMPNPMQILHYTIDEQPSMLQAGQSGDSAPSGGVQKQDMSQYVTKDDLEQLRNEIRNMNRNSNGNQNGSNPGQNNAGNRGGNK